MIRVAALALVLLVPGTVAAEDHSDGGKQAVLASWGSVEATTRDLRAYTLGLPEETRKAVMASKEKLGRALNNLLLRKMLLQQALQHSIDETETAQLRLQQARQDILVTEWRRAWLAENATADIEVLAREEYLANRDQYRRPERRDVTHILIPTKQRSEEKAREIIERVKAQIETGELTFDEAVAEYSEGPAAENNDGRINGITPGQMARPFDEAAFALEEPGAWTGPVKTRFGFHLIRLEAIEGAKPQPFEEVRDDISAKVRERYRDKLWSNYLAELTRGAGTPEIDGDALATLVASSDGGDEQDTAPSSGVE